MSLDRLERAAPTAAGRDADACGHGDALRRRGADGRVPESPAAAGERLRLLGTALLLSSAATSVPLPALEFECSLPGDTRFVRLDIPGEDHLCEVSVTGDGGSGERRVLWYADNETLFCSAKIYELHDKYVEEFGFDCTPWPDHDGIDRLSARQRAILDRQLKSLLGGVRTDEPEFVVEGVRAAASTPLDDSDAMLALQFFLSDDTDRVRIIADEGEGSTVLADIEELEAWVEPVAGFSIADAFVGAISESGAIDVITLLTPNDAVPGRGTAAPCEGRQTLSADTDGKLVSSSPHRHVCTTDGAIDSVPSDAG